MQILPNIHISCSTHVFRIFPWGDNKLLTYKSAVVKYPTSVSELSIYSSVKTNLSFRSIKTDSETRWAAEGQNDLHLISKVCSEFSGDFALSGSQSRGAAKCQTAQACAAALNAETYQGCWSESSVKWTLLPSLH